MTWFGASFAHRTFSRCGLVTTAQGSYRRNLLGVVDVEMVMFGGWASVFYTAANKRVLALRPVKACLKTSFADTLVYLVAIPSFTLSLFFSHSLITTKGRTAYFGFCIVFSVVSIPATTRMVSQISLKMKPSAEKNKPKYPPAG